MAPGPPSQSLMEQTCNNLKLTLSKSGGIPSEQLCCDYRNLTGEGIPFRKLGFDSLGALLESLPESLIVRRLPTGGMMVALTGTGQQRGTNAQGQNIRNLKNTRNFSNPKKPVRRPKQQSITWSPPNKNNNRSKENLHSHVHKQNSSGSSSSDYKKPQKQFNNNNNHNHQISNDSKKALRQPKPPKHSTNEGNKKNEKNGKTSNQDKHSSKPLLEEYFRKKNFGEVVFKIATMGNKGKERFLATITVDNVQYKTYPQTYATKDEAEEAVSELAIKKLGVTDLNIEPVLKVSKDLFIYTERVTDILGARSNGVWSHQVESEYSEKFNEKLPVNWVEKLQEINQIKVDSPVPNSVRVIVFPTGLDFLTNLPPNLNIPEDNIWEVFVTVVRSVKNVNCRIIGSKYSEMYDNLISDMDLHYFDKTKTPGVTDIIVGKLYAAQVSSDWHRVKVVSTMLDTCSCYFIDHGDVDTILREDLRELDRKFLIIPPQVLTVEVSGLQDYEQSDTILNQLNQNLLGKPLAAMVENRGSFAKRVDTDSEELPKLIFFDTSTEDVDININQKLIEFIVKENSHSKLPKAGGEEIKVTVPIIMSNGDLYVRKESDTNKSNTVHEGHLTVLASNNSSETMAIRCRLEGAPPKDHKWSEAATEAFRELVGEDDVVHLRVIRDDSECPHVELNLPGSNDGSINFDLSTEFDIFPLDSCDVIKQEVNNNVSDIPKSGPPSSELNISDILSLKTLLPASIPEAGDEVEVTVSYAVSPDNFVILVHSANGEALSELIQSMSEFYNSSSLTMSSLDQDSDNYAVAKLNDKHWQRVEVLQVIPNGEHSLAVIRYVDQGSQAMLDQSQLRPLVSQFRNLPCQAVSAALTGVKPANGGWSPEDNYWFNNRVAGKKLSGKVVDIINGTVSIELKDVENDTFIHQKLIQDGRGTEN